MSVGPEQVPHDGDGADRARGRGGLVSGLRSVLRGPGLRSFRLLFATRLVGQFGDGAFQVALAAYVIFSPQNQATAAKVAQAFALLLLPFTVVGPFAGVFLDRWPRRQVLAWVNALRAALVIVVALTVALHAPVAVFYICALAVLSANRFILAGLSAALPHTVPARQLVIANAVCPTAGTIASSAGALVSFLSNTLFGAGSSATVTDLVVVCCLYVAAASCALAIPRRQLGPDEAPEGGAWDAVRSVLTEVAQGARHVMQRPTAGRALLAISVSRFCYGVVTILTLLMYRNLFNNPADPSRGLAGFAFAVGLSGVGFGLGAVVTPIVTRRMPLPVWIATCLLAAAVTELVGGLPFRQVPLLAGALLLGLWSQSQKICTDTLVQRSIDDAFRGRVFVFYDMLYNGAYVLAAAFAAATLPPTGRSAAVVCVVAGLYAVSGAWYTARTLRAPVSPAPAPTTPPGAEAPSAQGRYPTQAARPTTAAER